MRMIFGPPFYYEIWQPPPLHWMQVPCFLGILWRLFLKKILVVNKLKNPTILVSLSLLFLVSHSRSFIFQHIYFRYNGSTRYDIRIHHPFLLILIYRSGITRGTLYHNSKFQRFSNFILAILLFNEGFIYMSQTLHYSIFHYFSVEFFIHQYFRNFRFPISNRSN